MVYLRELIGKIETHISNKMETPEMKYYDYAILLATKSCSKLILRKGSDGRLGVAPSGEGTVLPVCESESDLS